LQGGKNAVSVYIIAEAGVNHNGKIDLAIEMVDQAKEAGADCIKFQTFISRNLVAKSANQADYQIKNTGISESQLAMLRKLELSYYDFMELNQYCKDKNIQFLSSPFDLESIDFLNNLAMPFWKIPSGEITNLPYLLKIAKTHKPVILSTGMSTLDEIQTAIDVLNKNECGDITLLHCTTEYPAPYQDVNLKAMITLRNMFQVPVGYSDHTLGIEIPIAAVAMGAKVIEKHFTLDRNMEGPDHKASLEPHELKAMVSAIRNVEAALGSGEKKPSESEKKNIAVARKSIVARRDIKKGEVFTEENITTKRPGNGISPMRWFEVLGKKAIKYFKEDELIIL
jgi:N,N'-diacetyllegionaminate synthase